MQKEEGSRRLRNQRRAKEATNWAETGLGLSAQAGRPRPVGPTHFRAQSAPPLT
jgi:hypothetical protein